MSKNKVLKSVKCLVLVFLLSLSTVIFVGCGEDEKTVNIGYFNNVTHAQALLMKSEGALEKSLGKDINVEWTAFNAGPAEVEALFSGDIDIGYIGPVPAVTANVKSDGDISIISSATKGGAILVKKKGSDIESAKDLANKTVSIPQIGNTQHLCLLNLLSENGLKPVTEGGNVNVTAVQNADVENLMERGDIDAAIVPEPWGATLLEKGAELVLDYDEIYYSGDYDVAVVVVRNEFKEEHPDIVEKFLKQHNIATETITSDKEDCLKKINTELKESTGKSLGEDIISESFTRIGVSTRLNKDSILDFAKISKEQDFIKEIPSQDSLFTK